MMDGSASEFTYKAVLPDGRLVEETISAPRRDAAITMLLARQLTVLEITPRRRFTGLRSILSHEIGSKRSRQNAARGLLRRLSLLTGAGVTLEAALQMIAADGQSQGETRLGQSLLMRLRDGSSLSAAMQSEPDAFPISIAAVVRAGEVGGSLATALSKLSARLDKAETTRREFESALIYPCFLILTAFAAVGIVLLAVIPQLEPIFADSHSPPPLITQMAFFLSDWLRNRWPFAVSVIVGLPSLLAVALQAEAVREGVDRRVLKAPAIGKTLANAQGARFARTLSAMLEGGVQLMPALKLCEGAIDNYAFRQSIRDINQKLREGQTFSVLCAESGIIPKMFVQLAALGEATGRLGIMLGQCAEILDAEVERDLNRFVTFLTPALTFLVGGFVAAIVASVMIVISSLGDALQ